MSAPRQILSLAALGVAVLAAGLAAAWVAWPGGGGDSQETGPLDDWRATVGSPAPDFVLVDALDDGSFVRLSGFRGKVVVLNWFASWCGPCWAEMPVLQEAQDQLADRLVVIGLNLMESRDDALEVIEGTGVTYVTLLDAEGAVATQYRIPGMPSTYFIDAEGIIRGFGAGTILPGPLRDELARLGLTYTPSAD